MDTCLYLFKACLCLLIVLRVLLYTRPGRPLKSRVLAYLVQLSAGIEAAQCLFLIGPVPDLSGLFLLALITVSVWTVGGDVIDIFKPGVKHEIRR